MAAIESRSMTTLAKSLFNIPSNLYPGDQNNNRLLQGRLDPPKHERTTGGRSNDASNHAKALYAKYQEDELQIYPDPSSSTRALSSDKPPDDESNDYVTI